MQRTFDIIIWGASGFTGRLVAEYLAQHYAGRADAPRWAMAGRNADKLAEVRDLIGAAADTPLLVADADDPASLDTLVRQSRVILTTVGPYQLYGDALVAACARAGTHYADLCGEPAWMQTKIAELDDTARASGACINFSCGFDSIPFDLGVFALQAECARRFGAPAPRIKGRVRAMQGSFSGGTAASFRATMAAAARDASVIAALTDAFALTPGFRGPDQPTGNAVAYDAALGTWCAPFIMASINTKNVHRSNALLGHAYGQDFVYDEMLMTGPGDAGEAAARHVASTPMIGTPNDPQPGEGPDKAERDAGHYDILFVAEYPDGRSARLSVKGDKDPGYGSTSKMLAETGMALLHAPVAGGIWTPGAALGSALIARLEEHAGIKFTVEGCSIG
ncbi:MAG: saccharopine dehydrogenase NADP-binding domain-containing protein [Sphingomonadaceae bacterium]|nr:saccharopine dehydrogenase NADP-binding domain-containing protein [Sphingomonadaceae bacterium]